MALKIFGTDPENQPRPRQRFTDDVVARFRSGHVLNNRPVALTEWRVTTGDPEVATVLHDLLGGDAPQAYETEKEDNLEVFTASKKLDVLIDPSANPLRQRMVLFSRTGKLIVDSDGETLSDGTPDPDAELSFQERKQKGRDGTGPTPQIEVFFRLKDEPDLGIMKFQTGSWSMAEELAANDVEGQLADFAADGVTKLAATLELEEVSYTVKKGPRAGSFVSYTKPVLTLKGAVA